MLQMLGHEVRAPQSCSLSEKVALGREVQAVQHRALRLQIRLAPQNDALACAPARRELGIWALSGTGAARVGRGGLNCLEADAFWRGLWGVKDDLTLETPHAGRSPMCAKERVVGAVDP